MKILPTAKYICQPEFVERLLCAEQVSCFRVKLLVESREDTEEIAIWNQYLDSIFRRNTSHASIHCVSSDEAITISILETNSQLL